TLRRPRPGHPRPAPEGVASRRGGGGRPAPPSPMPRHTAGRAGTYYMMLTSKTQAPAAACVRFTRTRAAAAPLTAPPLRATTRWGPSPAGRDSAGGRSRTGWAGKPVTDRNTLGRVVGVRTEVR